MKVWDGWVRTLHWLLVAGVVAAWFTSSRWTRLHEPVGLAVLAVITVRCVWGFVGGLHARFTQFVRGPGATWRYARALLAGREPRYLGHNPLGGWMVIALVLCVAALAVSGWLYTTDMFWGSEAVQQVHGVLAWGLLSLVLLHMAGVVFTSWRHRENLVAAMVSGIKKPPDGSDIG